MEEILIQVLENYPVAAPVIFVIVRTLPIIIPPIPGIFVDIVGILMFGWLYGFVLAGFGVMIAAMITFYIARYFREPLLQRFVSLNKIHVWEEHFSEKQKFWYLVWLRVLTGPFFDYLSYAAGLTKMKASTFFWSTLFGALPWGLVIYYFGETTLTQGPVGITLFTIAMIILVVIFRQISQQKINKNQ